MMACLSWLSDDYLVGQGFELVEPAPGLPREAIRGALRLPIGPRCQCCPEAHDPAVWDRPAVVGGPS